jgi:hypothetical protein
LSFTWSPQATSSGDGDASKALGLTAGSKIIVALVPMRATSTGYQFVHVAGDVSLVLALFPRREHDDDSDCAPYHKEHHRNHKRRQTSQNMRPFGREQPHTEMFGQPQLELMSL